MAGTDNSPEGMGHSPDDIFRLLTEIRDLLERQGGQAEIFAERASAEMQTSIELQKTALSNYAKAMAKQEDSIGIQARVARHYRISTVVAAIAFIGVVSLMVYATHMLE